MPDPVPAPQPTPPVNAITIPIPSFGGITDNAAFRQLLSAAITIAILYASARLGVPVVPVPAPTPVVPPTMVSQ